MQKITPCLWFSGRINEALDLYTRVFRNSKVKVISYYPKESPILPGEILTAVFEIENQEFMLLNGTPEFPFTQAVSFTVNCETKEEIDHYWNSLTANGGKEIQCGWLEDPFGLSWQITPIILDKYITDSNPKKALNVFEAMSKMIKLDIAQIEEAYNKE
ncbi:VOC family protein [Flavobacterium sp. Sd200]|uniref:VOC family protein n=1 Tax=Flavobacterium sp. Sd200 TaxID=2692211 RepID=UPI00136B5007|nr:VOC family protein [Flavobacterium sp. Sd200]MXN91641.1 VOC family protein [Flavobacterium sp. Sd200]